MPKLEHIKPLNQNLSIGVQRGQGTKDPSKGVWTARLWFAGYKSARFKTTKVPYDNGSISRREEAERIAYEIYGTYYNAATTGEDDGTPKFARVITDEYLKEIENHTEANETFLAQYPSLDPPYEVKGGRGYWDIKKLRNSTQIINDYVLPFWKTLKAGRDEAELHLISPQQLDTFSDFMREINPTLSPSSILKGITEIRHVYRYAYRKGIVKSIPNPARPKRQLDKRVRREITESDYQRIIAYTRERYLDGGIGKLTYWQDGEQKQKDVDTYRDYSYLFHLWILVLANTGIRSPTSGTEHTQMKWEHYVETDEGGLLRRPKEKNHTYTAIVMPYAIEYFRALRKFQEDRDITSEYIFAHPQDGNKGQGWNKGDPIKNFATQWRTMLVKLGLDAPKGAPQSQRITPSALRSFFITHRLKDGSVNIHSLALATGTSYEEIMKAYYRFSTEAEYTQLSKGGYTTEKPTKPIFDKDTGYYVGREDIVSGDAE